MFFLYTKTVGSIIRDIAENRCLDGHLLNLEQLSECYAISLHMICRVIKFLDDLQSVRTHNGLGSHIVYSPQQKISFQQWGQLHPLLDHYTCMLELTELLTRATLSVCMEHCIWKELEGLTKKMQEKERSLPESALFITKHHENLCICNIAEQLEEAASGSMLIRTLSGHETDEQARQGMKSLCQTLRNRERRRAVQFMQFLLHNETDGWRTKRR